MYILSIIFIILSGSIGAYHGVDNIKFENSTLS